MKNEELRQWFRDWYSWQKEPVPLNVGNYMLSPDIRVFILNSFKFIDTNRDNKKFVNARYGMLEKVKEAIENESHDISGFGWTVMEKYLDNKK